MSETDEKGLIERISAAGLLSNGRYSVVVEADGGGHSSYDGRLLTPRLGLGTILYIQDGDDLWSSGSKAVPAGSDDYEAMVGPGTFRIRRKHGDVTLLSDACVATNRDVELRRYTISNRSSSRRRLILTAVTELVSAHGHPGDGHGASSTQTELVEGVGGMMAVLGGSGGSEIYLLHAMTSADGRPAAYETDGDAFFGPAHSLARPPGLIGGLTGASGARERPVLVIQIEVELDPGGKKEVTLACSASRTKNVAMDAVGLLGDEQAMADAFLEAALREQRVRDRLKLGPRHANRLHRVAAAILRGDPALGTGHAAGPRLDADSDGKRASDADSAADRVSADDAMRRLGLDPSVPLAVCRIADESEIPIARLILKARSFWLSAGLFVQVLFINDKSGAGANEVQQDLHEAVEHSDAGVEGVVLRHADVLIPEDQRALQNAARLVLTSERVDLLRVHD